MIKEGNAIKYGDDVNTDVIIPARYLNSSEPEYLAEHCMEDIDPTFVSRKRDGDIIVGGDNFGCGSSREHAPLAIKASGISVVIAKSFARIFYRNAINIGLPIVESPEAAEKISDGDRVSVELGDGVITDITTGEKFSFAPFPEFIQNIVAAGGLVGAAKKGVIG